MNNAMNKYNNTITAIITIKTTTKKEQLKRKEDEEPH